MMMVLEILNILWEMFLDSTLVKKNGCILSLRYLKYSENNIYKDRRVYSLLLSYTDALQMNKEKLAATNMKLNTKCVTARGLFGSL